MKQYLLHSEQDKYGSSSPFPQREFNLLRPFEKWFVGKTVLAIGPESGVLSHILTDWKTTVTVIDSPLSLNHYQTEETFDAILLIGTLESPSPWDDQNIPPPINFMSAFPSP